MVSHNYSTSVVGQLSPDSSGMPQNFPSSPGAVVTLSMAALGASTLVLSCASEAFRPRESSNSWAARRGLLRRTWVTSFFTDVSQLGEFELSGGSFFTLVGRKQLGNLHI